MHPATKLKFTKGLTKARDTLRSAAKVAKVTSELISHRNIPNYLEFGATALSELLGDKVLSFEQDPTFISFSLGSYRTFLWDLLHEKGDLHLVDATFPMYLSNEVIGTECEKRKS